MPREMPRGHSKCRGLGVERLLLHRRQGKCQERKKCGGQVEEGEEGTDDSGARLSLCFILSARESPRLGNASWFTALRY